MLMFACLQMCIQLFGCVNVSLCSLYAHILAAPNHTVTVVPPAEAGSE